MRAKYVEERWRRWFFFGGTDVSDSEGDVLIGLSREDAQRVIDARNRFVDVLVEVLMKNPDVLYSSPDATRARQ